MTVVQFSTAIRANSSRRTCRFMAVCMPTLSSTHRQYTLQTCPLPSFNLAHYPTFSLSAPAGTRNCSLRSAVANSHSP